MFSRKVVKVVPLQVRQGDLLIEQIDGPLPKYGKQTDCDNIVLAYGEVTGHAHRIASPGALLFVADRPTTSGNVMSFFSLKEPAELTHEEHAPIKLPAGNFRVVRQREYDPRLDRTVVD